MLAGVRGRDAARSQLTAAAAPVASPQPRRGRARPAQLDARDASRRSACTARSRARCACATALATITAVYELGFDLPNESIFVSYDATLGEPEERTKPMLAAIKAAGFDPWLAKDSCRPADVACAGRVAVT